MYLNSLRAFVVPRMPRRAPGHNFSACVTVYSSYSVVGQSMHELVPKRITPHFLSLSLSFSLSRTENSMLLANSCVPC